MDFTRQPIIETVITPREGYRLVVRSSKNASQEEHFVDALEVVSFGNALFFRCLERPKPFIVPSADYEVLEVREPRIVLKTPSQEKAAAPREREQSHKQKAEVEKKEPAQPAVEKEESAETEERAPAAIAEGHSDRRRERRRPFRRRRGQNREEISSEVAQIGEGEGKQESTEGTQSREDQVKEAQKILTTAPMLSSILPPPTTLIRDDIARLREQETYKGAFFIREDKEDLSDDDDDSVLEGLHSDEFMAETEGRDQEVSPEEPFCDPFFEEKISETIPQDDRKNQEGIGSLDG